MKIKIPLLEKFFAAKPAHEYGLLKLGTKQISAGIFMMPEELSENLRIAGWSNKSVPENTFLGYQILNFDQVVELSLAALEEASINAETKPKKNILILPTGLLRSVGVAARLNRVEPEKKLDEKELDLISQKIEEKTIEKAQQDLRQQLTSADSLEEYELFNTVISQYLFDDKRVSSPINLTGRVIEVAILHSFIKTDDLKTLDQFIEQLGLDVDLAFDLTLAIAVDLSSQKSQGLLVFVDEGLTGLASFKQGKVNPMGFYNLGIDEYQNNQELWQIGLGEALDELSLKGGAPEDLFLAGVSNIHPSMQEAFSQQISLLEAERLQQAYVNVYHLL